MELEIEELSSNLEALSDKLVLDPDKSANDLVKLVLSLVNTIRELMEKQALRKIMNDELTNEQTEKLGATFLALEEKMNDFKKYFNLTDDDLNIDLNKFLKAK